MGSLVRDLRDHPTGVANVTAASDYPELVVEVLLTQGYRASDGDWTPITTRVRSGEIVRGRDRELDTFRAGTLTLQLENTDRLFDPENDDGPLYPFLKPMRRIRAGIVEDDVLEWKFTGFVDNWGQTYFDDKMAVCDVTATDAFKVLEQAELPASFYELAVIADRPTHWWKLNDKAQAGLPTALDSGFSPDGPAHGTYYGNPTLEETGIVPFDGDNTCVEFDGVDDRVSVDVAAIPASTTWSIEGWFRQSPLESGQTPVILQFGANGYPIVLGERVTVFLFSSIVGGELRVSIEDQSTIDFIDAGALLDDDLVHHWAVRRDATGFETFIDGVSQGTVSRSAVILPRGHFAIGRNPLTDPGPNTAGLISQVAVWDGVVLTAAQLIEHYNAGNTALAGEFTGERVERILDHIGWPEFERAIDTGNSAVGAFDLSGESALSYLQKLAETENGQFYIAGDGKVTWRQRHALMTETRSITSQATYGDAHSAATLKYVDVEPTIDEGLLKNTITRARSGGAPQVVIDKASAEEYGVRSDSKTDLLFDGDPEAFDAAHFVRDRFSQPQLRIEGYALSPRSDPANLWPEVRDRKIGDRVTIQRTPQGVGDEISVELIIEGIRDVFAPRAWQTVYRASPAETRQFWLMGVAGRSEAGVTTFFGY